MTKTVNIAELKNNLSSYLEAAQNGDEIIVCKRNLPVAKITGTPLRVNRTKPGWDRGNIQILGEITGPIIPESDYHMLRDDFDFLK